MCLITCTNRYALRVLRYLLFSRSCSPAARLSQYALRVLSLLTLVAHHCVVNVAVHAFGAACQGSCQSLPALAIKLSD
jgi:hypothetical protein